MKNNRPVQIAAFAMIIGLFVAFRMWDLTASCLWFDEIFSVHAAGHAWDSILSIIVLDLIHPPLFYVLLKLWIGVGGEGLFWLRLFPVVFAVASIFPFIALCRELKLKFWTQILALFLFASNGSLIKYAQEVRMYSLLLCISLLSIYLFARYFYRGIGFIPLILVNIALVYTHYFGWFVVLSEVAAILIFQRIKMRRALSLLAITVVTFIPWIVAIWSASRAGTGLSQNIGWMQRPGVSAITHFKFNLIEPFYYAASNADPLSIYRVTVPLMILIAVAAVLYIINWKRAGDDEKGAVYFLAIFSFFPAFLAFAASWVLPHSIWGTRHLIIVFAPVSILLAIVVTNIFNTRLKTGFLTLIVLFAGYGFVLQASRELPQYIWCAWEKLADDLTLSPHYSAEKKRLFVFEDLVAYHFWYRLRDLENYEVRVVSGVDGIGDDPAYFLPRGFGDVQRVGIEEVSGQLIWIAFRGPTTVEPPGNAFIGADPGPPVSELAKLGFEVENVHKIEMGDQTAYLVLMLKRPPPEHSQ